MKLTEFTVPLTSDGRKAGDVVREVFPGLPESAFRRLFSSRDIKLDGQRISKDTIVRSGQCMKVYLPDTPSASPVLTSSPEIIYEDDSVLLVNKPAGISVEKDAHGGTTLTDLCTDYLSRTNPGSRPPAACHRLDHQTCGLCLFAKTSDALAILQDVFRKRTLEKYYVCLVRGMLKPPAAVCRAYLLKDPLRASVRILDRPESGARLIITGYETLEAGPVSRLRVRLFTGRTHQIRAHLSALGHPVLGDDLYGDRSFNKREKARNLKLCAVSLRLDTGGRLPQLDGREFCVDPPF